MDELFELLVDAAPFDWLLGLFGGGGPTGDAFEPGPGAAELHEAIARENARRKLPRLAGLERDRRTGRLSLPEFQRRYARLAGCEPAGDPAHMGAWGPRTAAVAGFLGRVRALDDAGWDLAEEHQANLEANPVVRRAILPRYRMALDAAVAGALVTAAAAAEEALRESVPEPRRQRWRLTLAWLPTLLVTDAGAAPASIASPPPG